MKNSNAVLEIPNFQQEDAGTYECVAENSRGKNAARGRISFHGKWTTRICSRNNPDAQESMCGFFVTLFVYVESEYWQKW